MSSTMLYLHTLSPLHCGTGQGSGIIDLPIVREATTDWPEVPGSGVKGVLRDACREANVGDAVLKIVFGPDPDSQAESPSDNAGGLWSASAQLVGFPVRSFRGSFAWIACPLALNRWKRDYETLGKTLAFNVPATVDDDTLLTTDQGKATLAVGETVLLEDFDLTASTANAGDVAEIATYLASLVFPGDDQWQTFFQSRFSIVSDDLFGFLTRTATEVRARVHLDDDRKIVKQGQLWYEETVPMETIFAMPLRGTPQGERQLADQNGTYARQIDVVADGITRPIQIGGNASVGYGIIRARLDPDAPDAGNGQEEQA